MVADKLKILIDKYYSGDILPDEYQHLLSVLKDAGELTPELEAERNMFLAIESCEPIVPEGLEDRLIGAINNRGKKIHAFLRIVYSGSVAAVALLLITMGLHIHDNRSIDTPVPIDKLSDVREAAIMAEPSETEAPVNTIQINPLAQDNPPSTHSVKEDLEKSVQIADDALMDVLASIHMAQNEVIDAIDNIEISQTTDYNIL